MIPFVEVIVMLLGPSLFGASPTSDRLRQSNARIDQICKTSGVPGASIGVLHHGKRIHTYNYGYNDLETKLPTASDSVYGIGSITKSFIAAAIAKLVDEKKLTWDTHVREILPEFRHEDPVLTQLATVTDILSHRCGLAGGGAMNLAFQGDGDMLLPKDSLFNTVNHLPTVFPLRQSWQYFVWGYSLAGVIIERVADKPMKDFLSESLFQPLGMKDTSFDPDEVEQVKLAKPYAGLSDGSAFGLPKLQVFKDTFFEASGGIFASLDDLLIWSSTVLESINSTAPKGSSLLKEAPYIFSNHAAMHNPSISERSYGLGWARTQLPGVVGLIGDNADLWEIEESPRLGTKDHPILMIYHQGSTVGYYSFIALFPGTNSAVVVLTNSIPVSDAADWIAREVIQKSFHLDDGHDYVALAQEANRRVLEKYDHLAKAVASMRSACISFEQPHLQSFIGRYAHMRYPFFIDIMSHPTKHAVLNLRFQGLESQTYELRHLCEHTFEWSLTHDESKRRGRYNYPELPYFLFKFQLNEHGEVLRFTWATDVRLEDAPEEFEKVRTPTKQSLHSR